MARILRSDNGMQRTALRAAADAHRQAAHTQFTTFINLQGKRTMARYLISFPSAAMVVPEGEWEAVDRDAHAVIDEAKMAQAVRPNNSFKPTPLRGAASFRH